MKKSIKRIFTAAVALTLVCVMPLTHCFAGGLSVAAPELGGSTAAKASSGSTAPINTETQQSPPVEYTKVELSNDTESFIATVDGDITITLLSTELDFVGGKYFEYYNNLAETDRTVYYDTLNTLKAITELNDYVKLNFVDPFTTTGQAFITRYSSYNLKYGDVFISCYSNFDGNPQTRYAVIELTDCFKLKADGDKKRADQQIIEKVLTEKLRTLRDSRDINVAYLIDLCFSAPVTNLRKFLDGNGYNFDYVNFTNEKLNGYDMLFISEPVRDITLEELILLDTFLDGGGKGGKSLIYFAPKSSVSLPNLHSLLLKWGIDCEYDSRLLSPDGSGAFADNTQLYAESVGTKWTEDTDKADSFYIMDSCTPITEFSGARSVKVQPLLKTKADYIVSSKVITSSVTDSGFVTHDGATLAMLSEKKNVHGSSSYVVAFSSADFLTTYFARQNDTVSPTGYLGNENGNLALVTELLTKLNTENREKASGLSEYALSKSELGIDNTSGIATDTIMRAGIAAGAIFIALLVLTIIFMNRRSGNGRTKRKKAK